MATPQVTPWGFRLAGNPDMASGAFEPRETELVRGLLRDVDILVNVGANVGYYCCHALSLGKPVIAFEPVQRNVRYLCENIRANGWSGAEIYPVALSKRAGILEIYGSGTGASLVKGWAGTSESHVTLVPSSTMDTVLGDRLRGKRALIIVDVEGAEKAMLEGATAVLANVPKPTWLVEIMATDHQPGDVEMNPDFVQTFQVFFRNGYRAFSADKEMRAIPAGYVDSVSRHLVQPHIHNFVFHE